MSKLNNLKIEGSTIHRTVHTNSKGEAVAYYSVDVFYRQNNFASSISSDWIAAIGGKLVTEADCYVDYCSEYHLEDFPIEEIRKFQDLSQVNSYHSNEDKRKIYKLFTEQLSTELVGYEKELSALYSNSI